MATDPDHDDRIDIDLSDVDLTDELPVLVETAVFGSDPRLIAIDEDDAREHTARVLAIARDDAEGIEALDKELELRAAKIEALENDIARLSSDRAEIERRLNEKDTAIGSLTIALEAARSALKERREVEERLAAEVADRDNRIARLLDKTDLLRKEAAEARTEVERVRQEREIERRETASLRAELERRAAGPGGAPADAPLREQLDTLTAYIANRRAWWDGLESRANVQAARIAELESVLAEHAARAATFEALAARETTRADALSAQLVAEARKAEGLGSELKRLQGDAAALQSSLDRSAAELERARAGNASPRVLEQQSTTDASGRDSVAQPPVRPQRTDAPSAPTVTPALICLTSEAPRPFALAKSTITIGRSSDCDIQILTHFVSREHARLTVSPLGGVLIEDLGSRNGVFVNSIRIDRQELHDGDVVTVGESQFRFLETMAH